MAHELSNRFSDLVDGSDAFFNNLGRSFFNFDDSELKMRSDVEETPKSYRLLIDLPGVDKKDMQLDYHNDVLTVTAKRDSFSDQSDADGNLLASERSYGRVTRQYRFPDVERDKITAKYEDGVLTVTLPKEKDAVAAADQIKIQ